MIWIVSVYLCGNANSNNLLDETARMIRSEFFTLQSTDYAPYKQKNWLLISHKKFCENSAIGFQNILEGSYAVKIAINEVKICNLRQNVLDKIVTSVDKPLQKVLSIQLDRISDVLEKVDEYLKDIDKHCGQRYGWEKQKEQIRSNYVSIFEGFNLEKDFSDET